MSELLKVKVGKRGDLRIPAALLRQARIKPEEDLMVRLYERRIIVEAEVQPFSTPSEIIEKLNHQGVIELGNLREALADDLIEGVTSEKARQHLKGVCVPIEDYIHYSSQRKGELLSKMQENLSGLPDRHLSIHLPGGFLIGKML